MNNAIGSFYNWYKATLRNTKYGWLLGLGTIIYLVSPIDIAPDFLPIIGWIDDGLLATLLVTELSQIALERLNKRKQSGTSAANDATVEPITTIDA
ncbi:MULTISPECIES: YkvA family protein [Cyanophyceae]|uniref:YkvA family protein n=1 Tax=unclassified Leptolyngbya TaxID=2650499 RepID=UPI0016867A88|nr:MULTISPECIES: YkvA family protein [Cyanophyceae]MBD1915825.1 DUF1232 domain-containing protein [Phormidium sp. FACHB-77]MBD2030501.1 DUF1232 domain-containing protein [Phormidium sp. FACHB-322]MBD2053503.1 DUF1232 domain-containing protein [Leptolyngbya sp. FACHB-60]